VNKDEYYQKAHIFFPLYTADVAVPVGASEYIGLLAVTTQNGGGTSSPRSVIAFH